MAQSPGSGVPSTGFYKARGDPDVRINMDDKKYIPRIQNQVSSFERLGIFCLDCISDNGLKLICSLFSNLNVLFLRLFILLLIR